MAEKAILEPSIDDLLKMPIPLELFVTENNLAMQFSISPANDTDGIEYLKKLNAVIELGSGNLSVHLNVIGPFEIPLIRKGETRLDTKVDLFKLKFIFDCVESRCLHDLNLYRVNETKYEGDIDANEILNAQQSWSQLNKKKEDGHYISDFSEGDEAELSQHCSKGNRKKDDDYNISGSSEVDDEETVRRLHFSKANRAFFTFEEDMKILKFIEKIGALSSVKGNLLWQKMESRRIVKDRSWQSLKERFRKRILPNFRLYEGKGLSGEAEKKFLKSTSASDGKNQKRHKKIVYKYSEDVLILSYIAKNKRYSEVGGVRLWKVMEGRLGNRSWQSLKNRFLTYILQHLNDYQLSQGERKRFRELVPRKKESDTDDDSPPIRKSKKREYKFPLPSSTDEDMSDISSYDESDTRSSRSDEKKESDTIRSRLDGEKEADTRSSRLDGEKEADTRSSRSDGDKESDTRSSRSDGDKESDPRNSRSDSERKSDTRSSRSDSERKSDTRSSRADSERKADTRSSRSDSEKEADTSSISQSAYEHEYRPVIKTKKTDQSADNCIIVDEINLANSSSKSTESNSGLTVPLAPVEADDSKVACAGNPEVIVRRASLRNLVLKRNLRKRKLRI